MKTIIKEGKKEFTATCSKCGCEFKYELSDISIGCVYCPCCDNPVYHKDQSRQDNLVIDNLGNPVQQPCNPYIPPLGPPSLGRDIRYETGALEQPIVYTDSVHYSGIHAETQISDTEQVPQDEVQDSR